ncbi:MAG: hypothetical protein AAF939_20550 [Planctomycetota bacterium]
MNTLVAKSAMIFFSCVIYPQDVLPQENADVTKARIQVESTQDRYQRLVLLEKKGSVNLRQVRIADFRRKAAILELSSLLDPSQEQKNDLVMAKLIYKFQLDELAMATHLHNSGSLNSAELDRAQTAAEVAKVNLRKLQTESESQQKMYSVKAAKSKLDLVNKELANAEKLANSGSVSRQKLQQAKINVQIAEAEYREAKDALGAKAVRVKQ